MEAMFKVSMPDWSNVYWNDFLKFLQETVPGYDEHAWFSISGPVLSAEGQNKVFDAVWNLLNHMPDYHIQFNSIYSKVYCSLIPVSPAKFNEASIGVAYCHEDDDFCYRYGCILAFARVLKDKELESQILMCDPQAAGEYFKDVNFDLSF